jgi:hypothetical protein
VCRRRGCVGGSFGIWLGGVVGFFCDALALVVWVDEEVGEVGDEVAVGEGVAEADELTTVPGGDEGVGVEEAVA